MTPTSQAPQTLSQEIINKANKKVTITDDLGRVIVLRKPKYSHYLNLLKALGSLASNEAYVKHITIFSAVESINGQFQPLGTPIEIDHLVATLEKSDDALDKIIQAVATEFTDNMDRGEFEEQLKK